MKHALFRKENGMVLVCCHVEEFLHAGEKDLVGFLYKLKQRMKIDLFVEHSKLMEKFVHPHIDTKRGMQSHEQLTYMYYLRANFISILLKI